jgi:hypothetical protein
VGETFRPDRHTAFSYEFGRSVSRRRKPGVPVDVAR